MKDFENEVAFEEEIQLKKPSMFRVLLHNDPYTLREFVVFALQTVFRKSESESMKIMVEAHTKGIAVVGIYTYEIAHTGVFLVEKLAEQYGHPLQCSMEEVEI